MDLYGNIFHVATVECDFEFAEVIEQEKSELWRRLLNVYFKDEAPIYDILKDEDNWEEYFAELLEDEAAKELFEEHFHRQLTHRYAGTLYGKTTVRPEKIVRQMALFVGTYHITQYIKSETSLSPENKLKCANVMLKIEIRSLGKDLERREDLCDDLLNEIYRHERKIDIKAAENDELILKNKSRHAKINILREELRKLGNPPDMEKQRPASTTPAPSAKSGKSKDKDKDKDKKKKSEKEKEKASKRDDTSCSSETSDSDGK